MNKYLREEYIHRINRVIDYIDTNINQDFTLADLAKVANFSPFHFHRIFHAIVNETLNQFVQRIRLEKAAMLLLINNKKTITEIAFDCGFSSSATFARAFKDRYGKSASEFRSCGCDVEIMNSKISKTDSKKNQQYSNLGKEFEVSSSYIDSVTNNQIWRIKMKSNKQLQTEVKVEKLAEFDVAYVRHIGPYKGDSDLFENLFKRLFKWAGPRNLLNFPETKVISVYHDSPEITDESKLRTSVCISVPKDTEVDGEIGKMTIQGGEYALARFEINADEYEAAWNTVYGGWLPESGYQPADGPPFELYLNDPKEHPEQKHIFDICVPVKPL